MYGPHEADNRGDILHDRAVVNVEVGSAAFASAGWSHSFTTFMPIGCAASLPA